MTQPTHHAEVYADDSIQKFQGRWVGPGGGWEWPVHARFVSWVIWFFVFPLVLLADWLITGSVSPLPLIDLVISFAITTVMANLTSGEVTLGHAMVYAYRILRTASTTLRRRISPPRPQLTRDTVKVSLRPERKPAPLKEIEAPKPAVVDSDWSTVGTPASWPDATPVSWPVDPAPALAHPAQTAPVRPSAARTTHSAPAVHRPIPLPPPPPSPFAAPVGPATTSAQPSTPAPASRPIGRARVPHQPHRWDQR